MRAFAAALCLAAVAVAAPVPKAVKQSDAERFVGVWEVACTLDGQPSSTGTWTFDAEAKTLSVRETGTQYRLKLEPSEKPKQIDIGDFKGIYEFDGDGLRIAFTTSGDRPNSFDPRPGVFDNRLRRAGR